MNILKSRHRAAGIRALIASAAVLSILCLNVPAARAQSGARDFKGETRRVLPVPYGVVDAGPVIFQPDTDHDGMTDDRELANGTNPADPSDADGDLDGDGLSNGDEVGDGTSVTSADTDADGYSDGDEVLQGYDPLDPNSHPTPGATITRLLVSPSAFGLTINSLTGNRPAQLIVTGELDNGTTVDLTRAVGTNYESLDAAVAVVDDFGSVVPAGTGATTIQVRNGALTVTASVTVSAFVAGPVGSVQLPGYANGVALAGNHALVAAGAAGLQVVDSTYPSEPVIVASLALPGNANEIGMAGSIACIAGGSAGLHIIDIQEPGAPSLIASLDLGGEAIDLAIGGSYVYVVVKGSGLSIVDISTPASPTIVGGFVVAESLRQKVIAVDADTGGGLAVLATLDGALILDVSDPSGPSSIASISSFGVWNVAIAGASLYLTGVNGLWRYDLADPTNPIAAGSFGGFVLPDVAVHGEFAFTTYFSPATQLAQNIVPLVRLSDPTGLHYSGFVDCRMPSYSFGTGVAVTDSLVFLTASAYRAYSPFSNGVSGDTVLQIGTWNATDTGGVAPTVRILAPQAGDVVIGDDPVQISVGASDDVGIARVEILANGTSIADIASPPYHLQWPVPATPQSVRLEARATDTAGNVGVSPPVLLNIIADSVPPDVAFTSPGPDNQLLVQGETLTLAATATDHIGVREVEFFADGVSLGSDSAPPYSLSFTPSASGALELVARAADDAGNIGQATISRTVGPDPGTSVIGRVSDLRGFPIEGASVVLDGLSAQATTGSDGAFAFDGVATTPFGVRVSVTVTDPGGQLTNRSASIRAVRGGITDLGVVALASKATTTLPTTPSAVGAASLDGSQGDNLFVGYRDRQSLVYAADGEGQFSPSDTYVLPFGPASAGSVGHVDADGVPDVIGQPVGQPMSVIVALSDGLGGTGGTTTLATGLGVECSVIAVGIDQTFPSRQLLAFLSSVDSSDGTRQTRLTVRITDDAGAYSDPLDLAVSPSSKIRNMTFFDVTRDGQLDLVVTEQVSGEQGRVLVFPRSSDGFGTPVVSPIMLRGAVFDAGTDDVAIGDYVSDTDEPKVDLFVLGGDRVRVYKARTDGVFAPDSELQIPNGTTPLGLAGAVVDIGSVLGVVVGDPSDPTSRAVVIYLSNAESPTLLRYTVNSEDGPSRPIFGKFGGNATLDVAIVDGTTVTTYLDIGPPVVTDKAERYVRLVPGQWPDAERTGAFDEVGVARFLGDAMDRVGLPAPSLPNLTVTYYAQSDMAGYIRLTSVPSATSRELTQALKAA